MNEREILYKILFDLKRDVTELKKILLKVIESGNNAGYDILNENPSLFADLKSSDDFNKGLALPVQRIEEPIEAVSYAQEDPIDSNYEEVITPSQDVTLSLEKQEKEIIIKALKKNKNKRKHAARDLGISERTLYRKIKQYDLEDLA
jgi:DNA-binding NtrC family response regulator